MLLLSPWELSMLKISFHRADAHHRGCLGRDDVGRLCRLLLTDPPDISAPSTGQRQRGGHPGDLMYVSDHAARILDDNVEAMVERIFRIADKDQDGTLSFREVVDFVSHVKEPNQAGCGGGASDALLLRATLLNPTSCVAFGSTMGVLLLFKAKALTAVGTMFVDPIRLFRGGYVDVAATVNTSEKRKGIARRMVAAMKPVMISLVLDCGIGVVMFTAYGVAKQYFVRSAFVVASSCRTPPLSPSSLSHTSAIDAEGGDTRKPTARDSDRGQPPTLKEASIGDFTTMADGGDPFASSSNVAASSISFLTSSAVGYAPSRPTQRLVIEAVAGFIAGCVGGALIELLAWFKRRSVQGTSLIPRDGRWWIARAYHSVLHMIAPDADTHYGAAATAGCSSIPSPSPSSLRTGRDHSTTTEPSRSVWQRARTLARGALRLTASIFGRHGVSHAIFFAVFHSAQHGLHGALVARSSHQHDDPSSSPAAVAATTAASSSMAVVSAAGRVAVDSASSLSSSIATTVLGEHRAGHWQASATQFWQSHSFGDTLVTAGAGCAAGAAYRVWTIPLGNVIRLWSMPHGHGGLWPALGNFRDAPSRRVRPVHFFPAPLRLHWRRISHASRAACKGLGSSLKWTMPITGVGFLAFEYALLYV